MFKNQKIFTVSFIILSGFTAAVAFSYIMGAYLNAGFPYNSFLFDPRAKFSDFFDMCRYAQNFNPYLASGPNPDRIFFPSAYFFASAFSLVKPEIAFVLFLVLSIIPLLLFNSHYLRTKSGISDSVCIFILSFLTYPFLFAIDRGNIEVIMLMLILLFIFFYMKEKWLLSIFPLSLAISMKSFPAVFIILLLSRKKYRETLYCLCMVAVLTVIPLLCFHGGVLENLKRLLVNMKEYILVYGIGRYPGALNHGCSLFAFIAACSDFLNKGTDMRRMMNIYGILSSAAEVILALFFLLADINLWKRSAGLVILMVLFPPLSGNYKLVNFFIPLFLFVNSEKAKGDIYYSVLFGLLLIPKNYPVITNLYDGVLIDPVIMIVMLIMIIINPNGGKRGILISIIDNFRDQVNSLKKFLTTGKNSSSAEII